MDMDWKSKVMIQLGLWHKERSVSSTSNDAASSIVKRIGTWSIIQLISYVTLLAAYVWMIIGLYWDLSGSECNWFQRSGAIVVFSAVLTEFFVVDNYKVRAHVADFVKITDFYRKIQKLFFYFGFFSILLGTVVWAYGDLLV